MLLHRCPGMLRGSATAFCRPVARPATAPRSRPSPALCRPSLACSAGLGFSCSGFAGELRAVHFTALDKPQRLSPGHLPAGQSLRLPNRPGGGRPQGFRLLIQANGKRSMGATGGGTRR